ncbi:unnamed protein product [Heligmosomoides polygyrus]|uniref:GDT1 family protein n=1 Tax=Heligmosomoides polygyrus TaxID=6339 RepID=A0A3P8AAV9_HELPZ|nr:unnamed protein product [Heligmosomoides polygyrus]
MFCYYLEDEDSPYSIRSCRSGLPLRPFYCKEGLVQGSGGHVNPAVTIGLTAAGKTPIFDAVLYIVSQLLGGVVGALITRGLIAEILTTYLLVQTVLLTAVDSTTDLAPLAIGFIIIVDILAVTRNCREKASQLRSDASMHCSAEEDDAAMLSDLIKSTVQLRRTPARLPTADHHGKKFIGDGGIRVVCLAVRFTPFVCRGLITDQEKIEAQWTALAHSIDRFDSVCIVHGALSEHSWYGSVLKMYTMVEVLREHYFNKMPMSCTGIQRQLSLNFCKETDILFLVCSCAVVLIAVSA